MGVSLEILTNFPEIADRMALARALAPEIMAEGTSVAAGDVADAYVPVVAELSPVDTGALQASTDAQIDILGQTAEISVIQPATNTSGGYYARFVAFGHWVMGGPGHTIRLWFWDGYHYPEQAWEVAAPYTEAALGLGARDMAMEIVAEFGGTRTIFG